MTLSSDYKGCCKFSAAASKPCIAAGHGTAASVPCNSTAAPPQLSTFSSEKPQISPQELPFRGFRTPLKPTAEIRVAGGIKTKPAVLQVDKQQANATACVSAVPTPKLEKK